MSTNDIVTTSQSLIEYLIYESECRMVLAHTKNILFQSKAEKLFCILAIMVSTCYAVVIVTR